MTTSPRIPEPQLELVPSDDELDADDLPTSIFGVRTHNGYITIENTKTGGHRTFQIRTEVWNRDTNREERKRVVSLLIGPNRESKDNWKRFGFADERGVTVWRRLASEDGSFEKFAALLEEPQKGENSGLVYHCAGSCRRCNTDLTNPDSIRAGIGPVCAGYDGW